MKWADMTGLDKVLADIQAFAKEDPLFWKPAPLLENWWPRAQLRQPEQGG